jgi:predicted RNase H-like HicB family nuclease
MTVQFVLSDYVEQALAQAVYDKLEDGTFAGRIPPCKGVVAFGTTLRECEEELRATLEDWLLVGLKLKHSLPVIADIDPNSVMLQSAGASFRRGWRQAMTGQTHPVSELWAGIDLNKGPSCEPVGAL